MKAPEFLRYLIENFNQILWNVYVGQLILHNKIEASVTSYYLSFKGNSGICGFVLVGN